MALTKDDLQQIKNVIRPMLQEQRAEIMTDTRALLEQELRPIRADIEEIKDRLNRLSVRESGDTSMVVAEIESLKKKIKRLEGRLAALEK